MRITPLHLEILLHYYTSPGPFPRTIWVCAEFQDDLIKEGILDVPIHDGVATITDKGKAWMHDILNTPFPTLAWIGRDGNVIKEPD